MISKIGTGSLSSAYQNNISKNNKSESTENKSSTQESTTPNRVDELKQQINDGTYKVDLDQLARKMADDLS